MAANYVIYKSNAVEAMYALAKTGPNLLKHALRCDKE